LSLRGIDAMERGQWDDAEEMFERAIEICPVDERAHCRYSQTLWRRGAWDEAISHMEQAVALSGGDAGLLVQLGTMLLERGELEQAAEQASRAISADRRSAGARALQGDILRQQGKYDAALASYHRAMDEPPCDGRVRIAAAEIYLQQGRPHRALGTLQSLADDYPPGETPQPVLYYEGLALKSLGRYDEAVARLSAARSCGPPTADLLYHLSEAELAAGRPTSARSTILEALALDPNHAASQRLKRQIDARRHGVAAWEP
jgi:tetratricopeptide (TPR) repeat protein